MRRALAAFVLRLLSLLRALVRGDSLQWPTELRASRCSSLWSGQPFDAVQVLKRYGIRPAGILQVGAHNGHEIPQLRALSLGPISAVEPQPGPFRQLCQEASSLKDVTCHRLALSDFCGVAQLFVANNEGQSSSMLEPLLHLDEAPDVQFVDTVQVSVATVDHLLVDLPVPEFWIIDTQGAELQVLRGASQSLPSCSFVFVEVNRAHTYSDCALVQEIDVFLRDFGLVRVLTRWWDIWGDALYVRESELPFFRLN